MVTIQLKTTNNIISALMILKDKLFRSDLINFIIGFTSVVISMFVLGLIDGYKSKKIELKLFLLSSFIFLIVLISVISIIGHAIYISGPTDYLASYIHDVNASLINGKVMFNKYCIVFMIGAYIFLYAPIILIAENLGVKIRKKQFINYKDKSWKN